MATAQDRPSKAPPDVGDKSGQTGRHEFTILEDEAFLDRELRPIDRSVLWTIAFHSGKDGASAFPGYARIAKESGCSRPAAIEAVKKLVARGHLRKESRMDAAGDAASNRYEVVRQRGRGGSNPALPPSKGDRPPWSTRKTRGGKRGLPELYPSELEPVRERVFHELRSSAAPRPSQAQAASVPSSLRSSMEEEAKKVGLDMNFANPEWWKELGSLLTKDGASEKAVLENWRLCLSGKVKVDKRGKLIAGKERFFVEDYSQYARYRMDLQCAEMAKKDGIGELHPDVLAVMAKASEKANPTEDPSADLLAIARGKGSGKLRAMVNRVDRADPKDSSINWRLIAAARYVLTERAQKGEEIDDE